MPALLAIGIAASLITKIPACLLPVLPVVLVAGATPVARDAQHRHNWRPATVVAGRNLSFSAFTLAGSALRSALDPLQDLLRDAGLVILGLVGLGLLVPVLGNLIERPFAHLGARPRGARRAVSSSGSGAGRCSSRTPAPSSPRSPPRRRHADSGRARSSHRGALGRCGRSAARHHPRR